MQITVATLHFGEIPYFRYTDAINRQYCNLHGYRYEVLSPPDAYTRSPIWSKVEGVTALLQQSDYVLFLDADAYFHKMSRRIEHLIEENMDDAAVLFGTDRRDRHFAWSDSNANCGVFLVRQCPEAFQILEEWWNCPITNKVWLWCWPPEQGAFNSYVKDGSNARHVRIIDYSHIHGVDGKYIRHLVGCTDEDRLVTLRSVARRSQFKLHFLRYAQRWSARVRRVLSPGLKSVGTCAKERAYSSQ